MREEVDLRRGGLRRVLPHRRERHAEVLGEIERGRVHGTVGRLGVRGGDAELL
jgi:hypothetical protein